MTSYIYYIFIFSLFIYLILFIYNDIDVYIN